jgi:hypothetical protein
VATVMCCLESALCTVCVERDFMRGSSVMWFWPFYHHVTDSRQVSPTTGSLLIIERSLSTICDPVMGIQYFLW